MLRRQRCSTATRSPSAAPESCIGPLRRIRSNQPQPRELPLCSLNLLSRSSSTASSYCSGSSWPVRCVRCTGMWKRSARASRGLIAVRSVARARPSKRPRPWPSRHQSSAPHQAPNPPCWSSSMAPLPAVPSLCPATPSRLAVPLRTPWFWTTNSSRPTMRASIRIPPPASGPSKTWVPPTALWSTSSV